MGDNQNNQRSGRLTRSYDLMNSQDKSGVNQNSDATKNKKTVTFNFEDPALSSTNGASLAKDLKETLNNSNRLMLLTNAGIFTSQQVSCYFSFYGTNLSAVLGVFAHEHSIKKFRALIKNNILTADDICTILQQRPEDVVQITTLFLKNVDLYTDLVINKIKTSKEIATLLNVKGLKLFKKANCALLEETIETGLQRLEELIKLNNLIETSKKRLQEITQPTWRNLESNMVDNENNLTLLLGNNFPPYDTTPDINNAINQSNCLIGQDFDEVFGVHGEGPAQYVQPYNHQLSIGNEHEQNCNGNGDGSNCNGNENSKKRTFPKN